MIVVFGGTGVLGRRIARQLADDGDDVVVATRRPWGVGFELRGIPTVAADLLDPPSVSAAVDGADAVVDCVHALVAATRRNNPTTVDAGGQLALIDAAAAAEVGRFLFTSIHGARRDHPVDFYRFKADAEARLRSGDMPFTVLRPTAFAETHVLRMQVGG